MSLCGLISFAIPEYFHFKEAYWATVTISAITRPSFSATFVKAILRLTGTLIGAWMGYVVAEQIGMSPYALFFAILIFSTITSYIGLQIRPYNYLSVVAGFSAVIVIESVLLGNIKEVAVYRTFEVCLGIIVMAVVSTIMSKCIAKDHALIDHDVPENIIEVFEHIHFSKHDLFDALVISLTASLSFLSWMIFRYPQGVWVTITLFVIMEDSIKKTGEKGWARFLGQVAAAIVGSAVAIFFPSNIIVIGITLGLGFFLCGMLIGYDTKLSATGNHAGTALAIMLLAGLPQDSISLVAGRFFNVLAGIIIATVVTSLLYKE